MYTACRRTLGVLLPRMKDFQDILLRSPKVSRICVISQSIVHLQMLPQKSTVGALAPPLGNTRLQTVHLITAIIEANDVKMNQELLKLNTISILLVQE